ncbi:hypothetical protein WG66_012908 [Moniliophthora roreri]|nr:hypothetical protein WG66_012908 [Moniliophthora roreri]
MPPSLLEYRRLSSKYGDGGDSRAESITVLGYRSRDRELGVDGEGFDCTQTSALQQRPTLPPDFQEIEN